MSIRTTPATPRERLKWAAERLQCRAVEENRARDDFDEAAIAAQDAKADLIDAEDANVRTRLALAFAEAKLASEQARREWDSAKSAVLTEANQVRKLNAEAVIAESLDNGVGEP